MGEKRNDVDALTSEEARAICTRFANEHKVFFDEEGECGFGRLCVGFRDGNWIDYNPTHDATYELIPDADSGELVWPPDGVNAYHKHDCMAVLGRGDEAVIGLARWVLSLEAAGSVEMVKFQTGAIGDQALISGLIGRAVVVRQEPQREMRTD